MQSDLQVPYAPLFTPSSQASPLSLMPLPQRKRQCRSQLSPTRPLLVPWSHCSEASTLPLPHELSGTNALQFVVAYSAATPGAEPALPPLVYDLTHHLHCAMHSVVVLGAVTFVLWVALRRFPVALAALARCRQPPRTPSVQGWPRPA